MSFNGKKVLITGGAGFIGSHLAIRLSAQGAQVTLIDSLIPEYGGNLKNIESIRDKVNLNITDVRDPHAMKYLVQGQEYLFNLAGQTSHMDSMSDPFSDLDINARAQLSILEACRQYNKNIRIVFAGTRQVYGKPDYLPVDEEHPIRPVDINGIHKMAGEWYHLLYGKVHGLKSTVLRLTNTYGPHMRVVDARQTFVGIWIRNILEGKQFEVWGGEQLRDFTFVDDCVDAMLLVAQKDEAPGQVYNLGGEKNISLLELAKTLVEVNGKGDYTVRQFPEERKAIDIGDYYCTYEKIKSSLGWSPRVSIEEGLKATLSYYRENLKDYV